MNTKREIMVIFVTLIVSLSVNIYAAPSNLTAAKIPEILTADDAQGAETSRSSQPIESDDKSEFKLHLIPIPEKRAESAHLEKEGIPSKILNLYDDGHKKLVDNTNPVPIIDTINEDEKYGNNGDKFDGISRAIVNGYEAFSNLLNTIIQKPKEIGRSITKGITAQLDILGGKLVGL